MPRVTGLGGEMQAIEFRILGPLEVVRDGEVVRLPGVKQRALLAILLMNANRVVSVDRLIDDLWGEAPPDSAAKALQVYVSGLRKCVEPTRGPKVPAQVIVTRKPGYVAVAGPENLDLLRFQALCEEGHQALALGEAAAASAALSEGLSLWRGPALHDFAYEPFAEREAARLDELRLTALEDRIEADLAVGRHRSLVGDLEGLAAAHPLRERLSAQLMVALYRSGRQAEALRAYQALRTRLAEELGLEPSSDLRALESAILRHDASLAAGSPSSSGLEPAPTLSGLPSGVVTFLLTDIEGSTALWDEWPREMADALERHDALVAETMRAAGGSVVKARGEGDATFSVFRRASDAVEAAVALQRALGAEAWPGGISIRVRMAIHIGEAQEREGDYFGPAVNRAARLRALARGGEILCSRTAAELLMDQLAGGLSLAELGSQQLRGLSRPEAVFAVVGPGLAPPVPLDAGGTTAGRRLGVPASLAPPDQAFFVGRETELSRLDALYEEAKAGRRRLVLVGGEPGVGKTRLVAQAARSAHSGGALVLYGRCDEGLSVPYQPFVEALSAYLDAAPPATLRAQAGARAGELSRLLPEVAARLPGLPPPTRADPETERYLLFEAVTDLLAGIGRAAPVVLVLDDLHWASAPTLLLLRHLLRATDAAILILATYRDTELDRTQPLAGMLAGLRRETGVERLSLSGLDSAGVLAYLRAAGGEDLDPRAVALANAIWEETEGNPFFVGEVLAHLVETGAVYQDAAGRWTAAEGATPADLGLPEGVREVVTRRLARLSESANKALSIGSVVGPTFSLGLVEDIAGLDPDSLLEALEEAAAAGLLREAGAGYSFAHALIRQTLYWELSAPRRMRLHRRVGEALEAAPDRDAHLEALAHHFAEAALDGQLAKAAGYALAAGRKALDRSAYEEAVAVIERGLHVLELDEEADGERPERCDLLITLGTAQAAAGIGAYRQTLLDAAGVARTMDDPDRLVSAALANSRGERSAAGVVDADLVALFEAALEAVGDGDSPSRAMLLAGLAAQTIYDRDWERRLARSDEALAIARRLGEPVTLGAVLNLRFEATRLPNTLEERLANSVEYLALAERLGDPVQLGFAAARRARVCWETGDVAEIDRCTEMIAPVARLHAYLRYVLAVDESTRLLIDGRIDEADQAVHGAFEVGKADEQPDAVPVMAVQLFSVRREQERIGELQPLFERAVADNPGLPGLRGMLGVIYCEGERFEEARALFRPDAADSFADQPYNGVWLSSMVMFAEVAAQLREADAAAVLYDRLSPWGEQVAFTGVSAFGAVSHYLGQLAAVLGRCDEAHGHFDAAQSLAERMGALTFAGRTRRSRALLLGEAPD